MNHHTKSIVRLQDMQMNERPHVHYPILKDGNQHDTNGTVFGGPFNKKGPSDVAVLHHYHKKSYGEYVTKRQRGRADNPNEVERTRVYHESIKIFEDALRSNSTDELGLGSPAKICDEEGCKSTSFGVFDDSAWTLLKKFSPNYAVFDQ